MADAKEQMQSNEQVQALFFLIIILNFPRKTCVDPKPLRKYQISKNKKVSDANFLTARPNISRK